MSKFSLSEDLMATGLFESRAEAARRIDQVFAAVAQKIKTDEKVHVAGFGILRRRHRAASTGRNLRTLEAITVPARTVIGFTPSKTLRAAMNEPEPKPAKKRKTPPAEVANPA